MDTSSCRGATESAQTESLPEAIKNYQTWEERSVDSDALTVDAKTLARFIIRAVLIGGPGMGKTTLLKRIARSYSEEHIPILKVRLITVAKRMRAGNTFEEAVFELGLDGIDITSASAIQAAFPTGFYSVTDSMNVGSYKSKLLVA